MHTALARQVKDGGAVSGARIVTKNHRRLRVRGDPHRLGAEGDAAGVTRRTGKLVTS